MNATGHDDSISAADQTVLTIEGRAQALLTQLGLGEKLGLSVLGIRRGRRVMPASRPPGVA